MNLWHDIPFGDKTPEEVNVIVEISKWSKNKYEVDKKTGIIALDRVAHTAQDFPYDYGFIPQTLWDDGDAMDVIILTTYPIQTGILARVRPVGIMHMIDDGDADDKVISVLIDDPRWDNVKDLGDINKHTLKEMEHFYSTYKRIQEKEVKINGFSGKKIAEEAIGRSIKMYKEKYSK